MLTLTSVTSSSEDCFDATIQAKFDKSDQIFIQIEEELMYIIEQQHQQLKQIE